MPAAHQCGRRCPWGRDPERHSPGVGYSVPVAAMALPALMNMKLTFNFIYVKQKNAAPRVVRRATGHSPQDVAEALYERAPPLWQNPERRDCTAAPGAGWGMPPPSAGKWPYAGTCGPPAPDALADALWSSGARVWKAGLALAAVMCEPNPHETAGHCRPAPGRCLWASPGVQGAVRGAGTTSFDMLV